MKMAFLKRAVVAAATWAAANPVKATQIGVAVIILASTLATTRRVDGRALKRIARVFL